MYFTDIYVFQFTFQGGICLGFTVALVTLCEVFLLFSDLRSVIGKTTITTFLSTYSTFQYLLYYSTSVSLCESGVFV